MSGDTGATWSVVDDDMAGRAGGILFRNADQGFALGSGISRTENGGESWSYVVGSPMLRAMFFVDATHGWAVGDFRTILATKDGGRTWQLQYQQRHSVE